MLPKLPRDPDPAATFTETPERHRIRQVLTLAAGLMELPSPVVMLCTRSLEQLSDRQCSDVADKLHAFGVYLKTGDAPSFASLAPLAEVARVEHVEELPAPRESRVASLRRLIAGG